MVVHNIHTINCSAHTAEVQPGCPAHQGQRYPTNNYLHTAEKHNITAFHNNIRNGRTTCCRLSDGPNASAGVYGGVYRTLFYVRIVPARERETQKTRRQPQKRCASDSSSQKSSFRLFICVDRPSPFQSDRKKKTAPKNPTLAVA